MRLEDLKKSISQMSDEELMKLTIDIRNSRRQVVRKAKKKQKRERVKSVDKNVALELLKKLGVLEEED